VLSVCGVIQNLGHTLADLRICITVEPAFKITIWDLEAIVSQRAIMHR
jgi:hypothetical protein